MIRNHARAQYWVLNMFDHEQLKVYFRDKFVHFSEANISICNTGFLYGLGVFSGIRAHYNTNTKKLFIFRVNDHYNRLRFGCKLCNFSNFLNRFTAESFKQILSDLIKLNDLHEDLYIRIQAFSDENRITPKFVDYKDSVSAMLYPLGDYIPTSGMRCKTSSWVRIEDNAIPSRAKYNGAYVNSALAKTEALKNGYDEAIFLDRYGHVVEGSAENIFVVVDNTLITPPVSDNILEGITRKTVIQIAKDEGIPVIERSIDRTELYKVQEVFLTGTGAKVSPVTEIDKIPVGDGQVGLISKKLQQIYFAAVRGDDPRYIHWLTDVYGD